MDEVKVDHGKDFIRLMKEFLDEKERSTWDEWCSVIEAKRKVKVLEEMYNGTAGTTCDEAQ